MAQGFMIFENVMQSLTWLTDEEVGMVLNAACSYYLTGEMPSINFNSGTGILWEQLRLSVDNAKKRHAEAVENGKKGAAVRYGNTGSPKPNIEQKERSVFLTEEDLQRQSEQDFQLKKYNAIDKMTPYL